MFLADDVLVLCAPAVKIFTLIIESPPLVCTTKIRENGTSTKLCCFFIRRLILRHIKYVCTYEGHEGSTGVVT